MTEKRRKTEGLGGANVCKVRRLMPFGRADLGVYSLWAYRHRTFVNRDNDTFLLLLLFLLILQVINTQVINVIRVGAN